MSKILKKKIENRERRRGRVRAKVFGTALKPRLSVFRSSEHIYAQLIDDDKGITLVSESDLKASAKGGKEKKTKTEIAKEIGGSLAGKAKKIGVSEVVFDRGGSKYHGRVKALSEGAREGGLKF